MKIYTQEQWTKDGTFKAKAGQQVEDDIYYYFLNVLPPICWRDGQFLCSEPYDSERGNFRYFAFYEKDNQFYYAGLKTKQQAKTTAFRNEVT